MTRIFLAIIYLVISLLQLSTPAYADDEWGERTDGGICNGSTWPSLEEAFIGKSCEIAGQCAPPETMTFLEVGRDVCIKQGFCAMEGGTKGGENPWGITGLLFFRCTPPKCPVGEVYGSATGSCIKQCPVGQYLSSNSCKPLPECAPNTTCYLPYEADPNLGVPKECSGNPINTANGNKFQSEVDFSFPARLSFNRFYNSNNSANFGFGKNWRYTYQRRVIPVVPTSYGTPPLDDVDANWTASYDRSTPSYYLLERDDGKSFAFDLNGHFLQNENNKIYKVKINKDGSGSVAGFIVTDGLNSETYEASGKLIQLTSMNGLVLNFKYESRFGRLQKISDNRGNKLSIDRLSAQIRSIKTNNQFVSYDYSNITGNLISASYREGKIRKYLYEDTRNPHLLTGIIDESGQRFATWSYNMQGQTISSEHAGGVDKYSLSFGGNAVYGPRWTDETDPLGSVRRYNFKKIDGSWLMDGKNQPGGVGCSTATNSIDYDANGNVASRTDFNGNKTTYTYDLVRNLETNRTEAVGTLQARAISTAWHPTWRLPITLTEPSQITTFDYDAVTANLKSKTITADGKTRIWTWTYQDKGLIETATDPDGKIISYEYDTRGNLSKLSRPHNQITQFTSYDDNGNLLEMTAADGLKSTFTYDARNRLKTRQTGTALTRYDYWPTGLLKQAALPNGQVINYVYDAAHRLSGVSDNRGNNVVYRLNNLGQIEQVDRYDPDGTLAIGLAQTQSAQAPLNAVVKAQ